MNIELDGVDDLDRRLEQASIAAHGQGVMNAVRDSAIHLQGEATKLAPIDLGDLRGSANTQPIADGYEVRFNQRYAAVQHEGLHFKHPKGGQAKYLEGPLLSNRDRYLRHISDAIKKELR